MRMSLLSLQAQRNGEVHPPPLVSLKRRRKKKQKHTEKQHQQQAQHVHIQQHHIYEEIDPTLPLHSSFIAAHVAHVSQPISRSLHLEQPWLLRRSCFSVCLLVTSQSWTVCQRAAGQRVHFPGGLNPWGCVEPSWGSESCTLPPGKEGGNQ